MPDDEQHKQQGEGDDEERRIRERLKAKLDSRNQSTNSSDQRRNEDNIKRESPRNDRDRGKSDSKEEEKGKDADRTRSSSPNRNGNKRRRRRRNRSRGRRHRNGRGGPDRGPPMPRRGGSRSPPGPPFGPGYAGPPPPYGGYPPYGGPPPGYPPYDDRFRGGPPRRYYDDRGGVDDFGRRLPPARGGSRSRSQEDIYLRNRRSHSYSRSRSRSRSKDRRDRRRSRSRSASSTRSSSSETTSSSVSTRSSRSSHSSRSTHSSSSGSSRSYSDEGSVASKDSVPEEQDNTYTKDQRTVFVTQLVMRTTERDLTKYFRKQGLKTNEIILLRDKRTGRHKGSAYVELRRMEYVAKAVELSGKPPDFQRFPILIKASEAEKNYLLAKSGNGNIPPVATAEIAGATLAAVKPPGAPPMAAPLVGPNGKLIQAQKLYVGNLDPSVSQEHLFALFNPFGQLEQVNLQKQANGVSKGYAFLQFRDPKEANLALQTMAGQVLAGRPLKTGWANQASSSPTVDVVTSQEFPADSTNRAQTAYQVLAQLTSGVAVSAPAGAVAVSTTSPQQLETSASVSRVPTVAEARASLAATSGVARLPGVVAGPGVVAPMVPAMMAGAPLVQNGLVQVAIDPMKIGNAENPSTTVLVHNMFNKDEETDPGWENDIKEEFEEESAKFGKILNVRVMHTDPGGKIYATFDSVTGAKNCASNLAGRWFDKRQLRVEFVPDSDVPPL